MTRTTSRPVTDLGREYLTRSFRGLCRNLCTVALLAMLPLLAACATSPATGRTIFTGGMSQGQEASLGKQEHEKIVPAFGGAYDNAALSNYVTSIGNLLASTSELPNLHFTFTVLDSPIVNAFALPGGYVYVTRGLLALGGSEAEIAGVIAHEIGHVTARHSAERYGQTLAANLANVGLGILLGNGPATNLAGTASALALRSFSREQESEADLLGVRYMSRANYDTQAMASFLSKLLESSRLDAELRGEPGKADDFNIMQTHPRTADRIQEAIRQANNTSVRKPIVARDIYLKKIDGMLYGDNPDQGFIRGRRISHPKLRFTFEAPEGFRLFNSSRNVIARGPEKSAVIFDQAPKPVSGSMAGYLTRVWGKNITLQRVETITINGMEAATGDTRVNTRQGQRDIRLLAIRYDRDKVYRMLFVSPPNLTASLSRGFREMTYSFRKLSAKEAAAIKPLRLKIYTVRPGDTAAKIAGRMPFDDFRLRRFLVMNGLTPQSVLRTGQKVKIVTE